MIVKNPTSEEITAVVLGRTYTVPAEGELAGVPAAAARDWQSRTHAFIVLEAEESDTAVAAPAVVEEEVAETVEVVEVVEAPVVEDEVVETVEVVEVPAEVVEEVIPE